MKPECQDANFGQWGGQSGRPDPSGWGSLAGRLGLLWDRETHRR